MAIERIFIGLPVSARVAKALEQQTLQLHLDNPHQTPIANYHLTMAYLGTLSSQQLATLIQVITHSELTPAITLNIKGIVRFPHQSGHIVAAIPAHSPALNNLHQKIVALLRKAAFNAPTENDGEQLFKPHITIARLRKNNKNPGEINLALHQPLTLEVEALNLYRGITEKQQTRYLCLKSWPLSKRDAARNGL
jgi:2'-5' RNA ligase